MRTRLATGEPIDADLLHVLLEQHRFGRYLEDRAMPDEGARRLLHDELSGRPADEDYAFATAHARDGRPLGALLLRRSAWDSEHFGFPVAVIDRLLIAESGYETEREIVDRLLHEFETWCERSRIRFAFTRIPARQLAALHACEESGFRYIETWLYNRLDLRGTDQPPPASITTRPAEPREMETMLRWARGSFASQRFHADPNIDDATADALYERWIRSAFDDPYRRVTAADLEGAVAGFFDYQTTDLTPWIGIRAIRWRMFIVDPARRGSGVGTSLLGAFSHAQQQAGFDTLESGLSLRNVHSSNLHARAGFENVAFFVTFHKWWQR